MIKKYLIACSSLLLLIVVAKLFIFCIPSNYIESSSKYEDFSKRYSSDHFVHSMSFANENMPLSDPDVLKRMKKALRAYHFDNQQTFKLHENAKQWFPLIESILKMYDIPDDFKYIPLVESGFEKHASSIRGASGYWQFMPQTARVYGLRVDSKVDERQDIRKSTVAACKYLRSIFREFKSWTLTAAAYNTGEDKLHAQINLQDENNYFKMKLNKETASYVFNLIAMKEIINNPAKYGYIQNNRPLILAKVYFHPVNLITTKEGSNKFTNQRMF
jgi:membrane-bound lytic murein transglycosylase D